MKTLFTYLLVLLSFMSYADESESRVYTRINEKSAKVMIKSEIMQAAELVDGAENERFLTELLFDSKSELFKIKNKLAKEFCEAGSVVKENLEIEDCGYITITPGVITSFGRGGWAGAGAVYTIFIGFTANGSGRFFESKYMLKLSEDVNAESFGSSDGKFIKELKLISVKNF